jgi:hypothetical protein
LVAGNLPGDYVLSILASGDGTKAQLRYFALPLADLPFNYNLDDRPPTDIAIWPTQSGGTPLAPRRMSVCSVEVHTLGATVQIAVNGVSVEGAPEAKTFRGAKVTRLPRNAQLADLSLLVS